MKDFDKYNDTGNFADLIFRYLSYNSFDTIKYELCNDIFLTADYNQVLFAVGINTCAKY